MNRSKSQAKRIESQKEMTIDDLKCCGNCMHALHENYTPMSCANGYHGMQADYVCAEWAWDEIKEVGRI